MAVFVPPLSFGVWIEVPCTKCSVTAEGVWCYDVRVPRRYLAKRLKAIGWTRKGDEWLCKSCANDSSAS